MSLPSASFLELLSSARFGPTRSTLTTGLLEVKVQLDRYVAWNGNGPMPTRPPKYDRVRTAVAWAKVRTDLEAARTDIAWRWPAHYLRHHYGTYSLAPKSVGGFGFAPAEVQASMGHTHLTTTLDTYIQITRPPTGWVKQRSQRPTFLDDAVPGQRRQGAGTWQPSSERSPIGQWVRRHGGLQATQSLEGNQTRSANTSFSPCLVWATH
jgi:hypothetical protein